jgi:hypothetical protein
MATEKLKINIKVENKICISSQINNHIKRHELGLIGPQT